MAGLFFDSVGRYLSLFLLSLWPPRNSAARQSVRRVVTMLLFLPFFGLVQLINWAGLLFDEIFYRSYRDIAVRQPVFVTGVPRSGTTLVHRTLALDTQFTTFSTWECLFAPSIVQRRVLMWLAKADERLGAPVARLVHWLEKKIFGALGDVHGMSLGDAEEDYFVFVPVMSCFILIVPFPYSPWLWDMGEFDRRIDAPNRQRLMKYYRRCVQKHLFVHGSGKRFLSKNASFPPLLGSLIEEFPDARLVCCLRDPVEVVPSQLSSLRDGMAFFGNDPYDLTFRDKMIGLLAYYYRNLADAAIPAGQRVFLEMKHFKSDLSASTKAIYAALGLELSGGFCQTLDASSGAARAYQSEHSYRLEEFGLDEAGLRERFAGTYAELTRMTAAQGPA